jgi:hypothetical protein
MKDRGRLPVETPRELHGVTFDVWLDIFLNYALGLAKSSRYEESYEICEAAKDSVAFYNSREDMFLIHVCWSGKPLNLTGQYLIQALILHNSLCPSCQRRY